jgi:hypothetical protein
MSSTGIIEMESRSQKLRFSDPLVNFPGTSNNR